MTGNEKTESHAEPESAEAHLPAPRLPGRKREAAKRERQAKRDAAAAKRARLYAQLVEQFGDPPDDPLALPGYMARLLAQAARQTLLGQGDPAMNADLRAFAGALSRMVPAERIRQAEAVIRSARSDSKAHKQKARRAAAAVPVEPRANGAASRIVRG